jgi:hypothetical protein
LGIIHGPGERCIRSIKGKRCESNAMLAVPLFIERQLFPKKEIFSNQGHLGLEGYSNESKRFFRHPEQSREQAPDERLWKSGYGDLNISAIGFEGRPFRTRFLRTTGPTTVFTGVDFCNVV